MIARIGKTYEKPLHSIPETRRIFATTRAAREKRLGAAWMRGFVAGLTVGLVGMLVGIPLVVWIVRGGF